jgi:hypothetical protein
MDRSAHLDFPDPCSRRRFRACQRPFLRKGDCRPDLRHRQHSTHGTAWASPFELFPARTRLPKRPPPSPSQRLLFFMRLNPERSDKDSKTVRTKLNVYSGEHHFTTTSKIVEKPGAWYCPIFGALITAASRLLLAMLERSVTDQGGTYLFCDTDSMAIVASRFGKLIPCPGGARRTLDGRDAVKALSWKDVEQIVQKFSQLNPYDRNIAKESILKIEDVNFDKNATPNAPPRPIHSNLTAVMGYSPLFFGDVIA